MPKKKIKYKWTYNEQTRDKTKQNGLTVWKKKKKKKKRRKKKKNQRKSKKMKPK